MKYKTTAGLIESASLEHLDRLLATMQYGPLNKATLWIPYKEVLPENGSCFEARHEELDQDFNHRCRTRNIHLDRLLVLDSIPTDALPVGVQRGFKKRAVVEYGLVGFEDNGSPVFENRAVVVLGEVHPWN